MQTHLGLRFPISAVCFFVLITLVFSSAAKGQDRADEEDGVVIGAVAISVAEPEENSSFLRGRKLDQAKWSLTASRVKGANFSRPHVEVQSGSEQHFLLKLKAGSYHFDQLIAKGFANFYLELNVEFDVTPKTTTYIGRLEIYLPSRMYEGPVSVIVADDQDRTVDALKNDNPELMANVSKALMLKKE